MNKKISFLILSNTGTLLKEITVSKAVLYAGFSFLLALFLGVGYLLHDYMMVQNLLLEKTAFEKKISLQQEEITNQRKQIQIFASKINGLKAEFEKLNDFEKQIRTLANFENENEPNGILGVGGPMEEDLDTEIALEKSHNELIRDMHKQTGNLEWVALNQKDNFESLLEYLEKQISKMESTPAIWPAKGVVTSKFGYRRSPFTGLRDFHKGLDIGAKTGTPIVATADGKVTFAGRKGLFGNLVAIDHGYGIVTRYGHMNSIDVKRGERVKRGQIIGEVGNTGRSTGSHLHYEVHLNGVPVNPQKYILN